MSDPASLPVAPLAAPLAAPLEAHPGSTATPLEKVAAPLEASAAPIGVPACGPERAPSVRDAPLSNAGHAPGGAPLANGAPLAQGDPSWSRDKVETIAQPIAPQYVPPQFRQDIPPGNGRPFPNVPRYGRKTRACVVLDRDVYIATAQRALALRLSVSACVNYALAQWVGKSSGTLERPADPAPSGAPSGEKKSAGS